LSEIDQILKKIPKIGKKLQYVPLFKLPEGTILKLDTFAADYRNFNESREINEKPEIDIDKLPEGVYYVMVVKFPHLELLIHEDDDEPIQVKSLYPVLTASACFQANTEKKNHRIGWDEPENITYRVTTGPIRKISIQGTGYHCEIESERDLLPTPIEDKYAID